jgi:hypothetical protein
MENPNRLPIDPYDIKTSRPRAASTASTSRRKSPPASRPGHPGGPEGRDRRAIPSIRIDVRDPALAAFAPGDVVPWCGQRKGELPAADAVGRLRAGARGLDRERTRGDRAEGQRLRHGSRPRGTQQRLGQPRRLPQVGAALEPRRPGRPAGRYWSRKPTYAGVRTRRPRVLGAPPRMGPRGPSAAAAPTRSTASRSATPPSRSTCSSDAPCRGRVGAGARGRSRSRTCSAESAGAATSRRGSRHSR